MNFYEKAHKRLSKFLIRLFRIRIEGAENEPTDGGYLVCANHISLLDVIVIAVALKKQVRFMAKKELFKVPIVSGLITSLGAFAVDRTGSSVGAIKTSISLLEGGEAVGIFPQGHRHRGEPLEKSRNLIKGGAAMAAWHSKVPVLPMYIETKNATVKLFRPITIHVGKPIAYEELGFVKGGSAEYDKAVGVIFDRIMAMESACMLPKPTEPAMLTDTAESESGQNNG